MKSYKQVKKELLKDVRTYKIADKHEFGFSIVRHFIQRRIELNMTQTQLAKRIQTTQTVISRFESGTSNPTVRFLFKLAHALEAEIEIRIS